MCSAGTERGGKVHKANLSEVTLGLTGPSTYPPPPQHSHEPPLFWATITIHLWLNSTQICIQVGWKPAWPICVRFSTEKNLETTKPQFSMGDNGDKWLPELKSLTHHYIWNWSNYLIFNFCTSIRFQNKDIRMSWVIITTKKAKAPTYKVFNTKNAKN